MNNNFEYNENNMKRYALIDLTVLQSKIAERAYFKWLNGSDDHLKNWIDAEREILLGI